MKNEKIVIAGGSGCIGQALINWVLPTRLLETGFQFQYPKIDQALSQIIKNLPRKRYHLF
jgi:NAD dependent epimerase/dehydratase family enzyme